MRKTDRGIEKTRNIIDCVQKLGGEWTMDNF